MVLFQPSSTAPSEPPPALLSIPLWSYFNFDELANTPVRYFFQSHFGLISTQRLSSQGRKKTSFNPTLVLFQLSVEEFTKHYKDAFNPTLVLFQLAFIVNIFPVTGAFNPTLVLFQQRVYRKEDRKRDDFQSHFGLISTDAGRDCEDREGRLSIPLWSYFNARLRRLGCLFLTFQSHFGLISTRRQKASVVSFTRFQSHFGLISTGDVSAGDTERNAFNPTLVLFQHAVSTVRKTSG